MASYAFQTVTFDSTRVITAGDLGFPATFPFAVFSGWFQLGAQVWALRSSAPGGACGLYIDLGPSSLVVQAYRANHFACITATPTFSATPGPFVHLLISFDASPTPHLQIYVNDVAVTGSFSTFAGPIGNGTSWSLGRPGAGADQCAGDVWIGAVPTFFDLSVTANRRLFIDDAGQPVNVGIDGSLPFGTPPQVFLHVAPHGAAGDFTDNAGSGGSFAPPLSIGACGIIGEEINKVLLPSAELQFTDANGHPYAGGTLELLVPGTTIFKDTWTDPAGAALNTNPIVLDAAGRCIVYGDGAYRSILKDALGNLIWDRETTTEVSAAMMPVVGAPTIAEAQRLLGIDDSGLPAEIAAREAADAAETAARIAADANLQSEIDAETAARIAADAALAAIGGPNVRAGTVTTNSSGFARITFATPFPTACQGITVTPSGQHAPTPLTATTNTPDAAGCDVYTGVYGGTSVAPAATSVYYIAVGN